MQGVQNVLSTVVQDALQEPIERDVAARSGAGRWERPENRSGVRNGSRPRAVLTLAGDVGVNVSKLPKSSFFPELLESRPRIARTLWGAIMTACITGASAWKFDDLVDALGCETGVSRVMVSRICADIDQEVAFVRQLPFDQTAFP